MFPWALCIAPTHFNKSLLDLRPVQATTSFTSVRVIDCVPDESNCFSRLAGRIPLLGSVTYEVITSSKADYSQHLKRVAAFFLGQAVVQKRVPLQPQLRQATVPRIQKTVGRASTDEKG
jgi:hypothetical protein